MSTLTPVSCTPISERVRSESSSELEYVIRHVFLPADRSAMSSDGCIKLPKPVGTNEVLASAAHAATQACSEVVDEVLKPQWRRITKMLYNLRVFLQSDSLGIDQVVSQLSGMETGDILVFMSKIQDTAVVFAKQDRCALYQSFERADFHAKFPGSYPDLKFEGFHPAWNIRIPNEVFQDPCFQFELANFLRHRIKVPGLLTSILRGVGQVTEVRQIIKHVQSHYRLGVSERSLLLLLIKIATRSSFGLVDFERVTYKVFTLCFMCSLAMDAVDANLSSCLLHAVSCKILRRLGKLGACAPGWLHDRVLKVNTCLRSTLEARWMKVRAAEPSLSSWKPSQLDLVTDSLLSLRGSIEYIRSSLLNHDSAQSRGFSFTPKYLSRVTLTDFLSTNGTLFEQASRIDLFVALYDVEQAVEQEIDDWVATVVDVELSCAQVKALMNVYLTCATNAYKGNPDHTSIMLLMGLELWVALDKLVVGAVPVFAEVCPGIKRELLHMPLFGKTTNLHRLCRVYQYLSARYPPFPERWSTSEDSIKDIFTIQDNTNSLYLDSIPPLKQVMNDDEAKSHRIIAVFELCGPAFLDTWCSTTACLLRAFPSEHSVVYAVPFAELSRLRPCLVKQWISPVTKRTHIFCIGPNPSSWWRNALPGSSEHGWGMNSPRELKNRFSYSPLINYKFSMHVGVSNTSNCVIAAQVECPGDISPHEFVAFGHLQSGNSLKWLNILQQVRSRTLNFRHQDVYFLLAEAALQIGPPDMNIAKWEWHQELQEPSFCCVLLVELEGLLKEVSEYLRDVVMMSTIVLLLTRLMASSPCEDVSERIVELLRHVRKQMLYCIQELSYDAMLGPMKIEWKDNMRDMAAVCRSTFDVDPSIIHKLFRSAEDICALVFCAILIHANQPTKTTKMSDYSRLLLGRDRRLSLALESVLKDAIDADSSNRGVDLAVYSVWCEYHPGPRVWKTLPHPNTHWLSCESSAIEGRCSQTMHLNLLDGTLLVDGKTMDRLPNEIVHQPMYSHIFGDQCFLVVPSDIPGMDFCTLTMIYEHRVHFVLRDGCLVIRAQYQDRGDIFEVIPHEKLQEDLPAGLINGHVHWLNLSTSSIEIRPLKRLWEHSLENWRIDCKLGQYKMYKGDEWLVDMQSPTYDMISSLLECLDIRKNMIITTIPADPRELLPTRRLFVTLPRYGMSFFVNDENELESSDFKSMVYDENQCIETLFGLETRLVLRPKACVEGLIHRCIIIPDGLISRAEHGHHARDATISSKSKNASGTDAVAYHVYHVNTDLGCLSSTGSWTSRLFLAQLHAMTSIDWMPDPLTGRTGIQQALCLLQSAGCRSIMTLRDDEAAVLSSTDTLVYPQLKFALADIGYHNRRTIFLLGSGTSEPERPQPNALNTLQAAYLFPLADVGNLPSPTKFTLERPGGAEGLAHTISLAVCHWLIRKGNCAESRDVRNTPLWPNPLPLSIARADNSWQTYGRPNLLRYKTTQLSISEAEVLLQEATERRQRFRLLFLLPALSYGLKGRMAQADPSPLSILVALAKQFPLKDPPRYDQYWPLGGSCPSTIALQSCFVNGHHDSNTVIQDIEEVADRLRRYGRYWPLGRSRAFEAALKDYFDRVRRSRDSDFTGIRESHMERILDLLLCAWPLSPRAITYCAHKNTELQLLLVRCYHNLEISEILIHHLSKLHTLCDPTMRNPSREAMFPYLVHSSGDASGPASHVYSRRIALKQLFDLRFPPRLSTPVQLEFSYSAPDISSDPCGARTLNQLFSSLRINDTSPTFEQQYITHLHVSAQHIPEAPCAPSETVPGGMAGDPSVDDAEELWKHYLRCRQEFFVALETLKKELGPSNDPGEGALHRSGQWPPITPDILLRCLASTSPIKLSDGWKKCLVSLALLLVQLQRSRRLLWFSMHGLKDELLKELENKGCDGWSAEKYPEWLLVQVQGNFVIRGFQADVAIKMISPPSGENTAMQVNMGEGKSSVIIPICAASLANGKRLLRVIIPKSLTAQTLRFLADRLCGLVNKPIYHLPISRSFSKDYRSEGQVRILSELLSECMCSHGILVVQPEHVLSLKLTSLEKQLPEALCGKDQSHDRDSAVALLQLQKWVYYHARDILDESDDILHPRFQLMYTIAPPQHMEGSPDRWVIIQQVLGLVRKHALSLSRDLPDAVEYERNTSGSFPRIRILRTSDARRRLVSLITHDVMDGQLLSFRLRDISRDQPLFAAVCEFINSKNIDKQKGDEVEKYGRRNGLWNGLLLLRGLLACDILLFALAERRWCVDYGLSPSRTKLAVPYRAKGIPAPEAEFGHPDIKIILTCLSYYYGGLTAEQLKSSFEILQEQDKPTVVYANWLGDFERGSVPKAIQNLSNVNVKSSEQWEIFIFPLFFRHQGAVDFYLSRFVFPGEAKEFPLKLETSGWDLVEKREHLITGISGTNDGQYLMPTSIRQLALSHQRGTDAIALSYLFQPENDSCMLITHPNGKRLTIPDILKIFVDQEPRIRVLLDIGAQILDFSNHELAETWLDLSSDSDGAVYFNDHDEPMVLTKDGSCRPLLSSAFAERLDRCVVYLDDAHTRGIDLKFPQGSRAAVTLGPKVTKDRLVQGCMRMRKLGRGHSVMFLMPLEVDRSIRGLMAKDAKIPITSTDVVSWAIHETWTDIRRRTPHWAQQGVNHGHRHDTWLRFCENKLSGEKLAISWLQPELQSLADLYAPFQPKNDPRLSIASKHSEIRRRCREIGIDQLPIAQLEEQEREVHREVEREREVDKGMLKARPAVHILHTAVVDFVKTGTISSLFADTIFLPISTALRGSSAAAVNTRPSWSPFVFATFDFCKTVKLAPRRGNMDPFLRSVQWVLSGKRNGHPVLVVVSPFEADLLMPDIRTSEHVHLHMYTPRTSERMKPDDDLKLYTIPPLPDDWKPPRYLIDQLNVFAGQLWLTDYESYRRLCRFLRIQRNDPLTNSEVAGRNAVTNSRILQKMRSLFTKSTLPFVMKLLLIRSGGVSFAKTHMGRILQGEVLTEEDFDTNIVNTAFDAQL